MSFRAIFPYDHQNYPAEQGKGSHNRQDGDCPSKRIEQIFHVTPFCLRSNTDPRPDTPRIWVGRRCILPGHDESVNERVGSTALAEIAASNLARFCPAVPLWRDRASLKAAEHGYRQPRLLLLQRRHLKPHLLFFEPLRAA